MDTLYYPLVFVMQVWIVICAFFGSITIADYLCGKLAERFKLVPHPSDTMTKSQLRKRILHLEHLLKTYEKQLPTCKNVPQAYKLFIELTSRTNVH